MKTATNGMGRWRAKKIYKGVRRSVTTGRQKGIFATPLERTICRRNRSWKYREYNAIMEKLNGNKRRKRA